MTWLPCDYKTKNLNGLYECLNKLMPVFCVSVLLLKGDTTILTSTPPLLSHLPSSYTFLNLFSFPFLGHLLGFILLGKAFGKALRIEGLDGRKCSWVVEQDWGQLFMVFLILLLSLW